MVDIWSPKKRSEVMSRIRKTDSGPEIRLRVCLGQLRMPYQTYGALPGSPDIILERSKLAIFVHGCFWHGCPRHYRLPKSNIAYWSQKLRRNVVRDKAVRKRIRGMGWHTAVVWECQMKNPERTLYRLLTRVHNLEGVDANSTGIL